MIPPLSPMMAQAADAPFATLETIVGTGGLIVLAPHPDDESLGCGALLRAAACAGRRALVVQVTDGRLSHRASASVGPDALARLRAQEMQDAIRTLHPTIGLFELGFADCAVPVEPRAAIAVARLVARAAEDIGASALLTPWHEDPHCDHAATAAIAGRTRALIPHLRLWSYPVWGRFAPTVASAPARIVRFDPGPHRAAKAAAIACHRSQMTRLIDDDPEGFVMSAEMQAHFIEHPEVFLAND